MIKKHLVHLCLSAVCASALWGCGGSGDSPDDQSVTSPFNSFDSVSSVTLSADGPKAGLSAYDLIENVFAAGSIEAPDMYPTDHTEAVHIVKDSDNMVGPHFVFLAHKVLDFNKGVESDRQRNQIKTYDKSPTALKGYQGETMQFSWKFKISNELELSKKFSHFFQLKAKNFSQDNSKGFNADGTSTSDIYLIKADWSSITDEWLNITVQATFAEEGAFYMQISRMQDNAILVDINEPVMDMWRGVSSEDFVRPKWGIYRSLADGDSLRSEEEQVRFADFVVEKGTAAD
ncbi:hypothetical protein Q4602_09665 [Paraglaciecola chathamensis]|uniref:hypothetical protein n=1 Tax=Paraglaciecola chathamensis TaxID=368405 RepID=UPI002704C595|nr:hypothetical protein [Paraglaciecola chathamensis]MDO6839734.1 hypothetical protein [Paraglaciecola chathamensis]